MSAAPDKLNALLEANRRLARLAITWFAVDPVRVERTLRAVQDRQRDGVHIDFVAALLDANILTPEQAEQLPRGTSVAPTPVPVDAEAIGEKLLLQLSDADDTDEPNPTKLDMPGINGDPTQIGPYRVLRLLGQGGMGAVYLAFDGKENRQVALKVLAADQAPKPNILRRFQLEGQHGARLVHDNIVRSYDNGQDADTSLHYIVLEYVPGPTAHDLLDRAGKLQVGDAVHIILDIARAVEHAHKNQIIHRDIKPANILITPSGLAKLSDLGLAKRRDDSTNLTSADQGIGTPYYVPYEQAMNAKKADERSDIFALGATLYHLVTGAVPFDGESSLEIAEKKSIGVYAPAASLNADVPPRLDEILAHMLARDPPERYQTASEVIVDLERANLSAAIPSFVNVDAAMEDPVVRHRLESPVAATQPDMRVKREGDAAAEPDVMWFLKYRDSRGNLCKSKATTAEILARLKNGTIPLLTEAARSPQGKFKPLEKWPEFQPAVESMPVAKKVEKPRPMVSPVEPIAWERWWWIAAAAVGVALVGILLFTATVILRTI